MTVPEAQQDMRRAYVDGATGVLASATAWLAAAIVAWRGTSMAAIATLLVGGMAIFPVSVLLSKALGRSGAHSRENPLATLAATGTIWMLLAIPVAYGASLHRVEWFFPAMLVTIGGRYLTFVTLYGLRIYYFCGFSLAAAGLVAVAARWPVPAGATAGVVIEYCAGIMILVRARSVAA